MNGQDQLDMLCTMAKDFASHIGYSLSQDKEAMVAAGFSKRQARRLKKLCGENPQNYYCELLGLWCVLEPMDDQFESSMQIFRKLVEFGNTASFA
jgi:hypothetical protein